MSQDSNTTQPDTGAHQAAASFINFLNRQGSSQHDLSAALHYQAAQARSGSQEITTPHREAMEAWVARLAAERRQQERELATLIKNPAEEN